MLYEEKCVSLQIVFDERKWKNLLIVLYMKKLNFCLTAMVMVGMMMVSCQKKDDIKPLVGGNALFSINADGAQVSFAPGNLIYDSCYHFAAHQYDLGSYLGWGTGANPTNVSTDNADYPEFEDWGNYMAGSWRTLSYDEWKYVVWDRPNAEDRCGIATVCGVHGMVLLPDVWKGRNFQSGFNGWDRNVYDEATWKAMESAGAVFLPAQGYREDGAIGYVDTAGFYWTSTPYMDGYAYYIDFIDELAHDQEYYRAIGIAVRLVKDEDGDL